MTEHIHECHMYAIWLQKHHQCIIFPGPGVLGGSEPTRGYWEANQVLYRSRKSSSTFHHLNSSCPMFQAISLVICFSLRKNSCGNLGYWNCLFVHVSTNNLLWVSFYIKILLTKTDILFLVNISLTKNLFTFGTTNVVSCVLSEWQGDQKLGWNYRNNVLMFMDRNWLIEVVAFS